MKRRRLIQWGTPKPQYYNGILMRANPLLHEEAFAVVRSIVDPQASVIDVGAGQGAFSARLFDAGYSVTAVDKDVEDYRAIGPAFVPLDFDSSDQVSQFAAEHSARYDAAIGMEVIEHVENPWAYCRFLMSLVKPGGIVLITTPNVESCHSRVTFLLSGLFDHFSAQDCRTSGHINPITAYELKLIATAIGGEIRTARSLCALPLLTISRRTSVVLKSFISLLVMPFLGSSAHGDITCVVFQKPAKAQDE